MRLIEDLKTYGVTFYLDGEGIKTRGLSKVEPQHRQVVDTLIKQAKNEKESIIFELKGSPISRSSAARIEVTKALIEGKPLQYICEILIKTVADITGDGAFETQSLETIRRKYE